jgi:hypothetical protein
VVSCAHAHRENTTKSAKTTVVVNPLGLAVSPLCCLMQPFSFVVDTRSYSHSRHGIAHSRHPQPVGFIDPAAPDASSFTPAQQFL